MSSLSREFLVEWEAGPLISPNCFRHPEEGTRPLPPDFHHHRRLLSSPPGCSSKPTVPLPTASGVGKAVSFLLFVAPHYTIAAQPVFRVELIGRFWSVTMFLIFLWVAFQSTLSVFPMALETVSAFLNTGNSDGLSGTSPRRSRGQEWVCCTHFHCLVDFVLCVKYIGFKHNSQ